MPQYSASFGTRAQAAGVHRIRPVFLAGIPAAPSLSRAAKTRLAMLDYARTHSVAATCRHFGYSRQTYYRWRSRYDPLRLLLLENRSCRPKQVRHPSWTPAQIKDVQQLREQYPRWGKEKLSRISSEPICPSRVGRILRFLHAHRLLSAPAHHQCASTQHHARPYARRKPKEFQAQAPGDLIEIDTVHLHPLPGLRRMHFSAVDVVSRYSVVEVRETASAGTAADFLEQVLMRMPYPVKRIQVDGGSEFKAEFEKACQANGLALWVLPPRSPKLNGAVERVNRTHRQEFWECYQGDYELPKCQAALRAWEEVYNTKRPHQALGYLTPAAFLAQTKVSRR